MLKKFLGFQKSALYLTWWEYGRAPTLGIKKKEVIIMEKEKKTTLFKRTKDKVNAMHKQIFLPHSRLCQHFLVPLPEKDTLIFVQYYVTNI